MNKTTFVDYDTEITAGFLNTLQDTVIGNTSYGTCSTAAGTAAKEVTISDFVLATGATVKVKFTNSNTVSAPTLNVNNTGAKAIKQFGTTAVGTDVFNSWSAGGIVIFVYDGTNWIMAGFSNTETPYFKGGQSWPTSNGTKTVLYLHGWVTGALTTITADISLPKPFMGDSSKISLDYDSFIARGVSGYVNSSSSGITPDNTSITKRSNYVITFSFTFNTALTNVVNNTPISIYMNGVINFAS